MALFECPECNNQVSDKAVSCPNCGCPFSNMQSRQNETDKLDAGKQKWGNIRASLEGRLGHISVFYCPKCARISEGVKICPKCYYPLKIVHKNRWIHNEDIADGKITPTESEIITAYKDTNSPRNSSKFKKCSICGTKIFGNEGCPKCLYGLMVERNGKLIGWKNISNGTVVPTELEIKVAIKNKLLSGTAAEYVIDDKGNIVLKKPQQPKSETEKLREEVAALRKEVQKNNEKDCKKKNIPWFTLGYLGSRLTNELKKKK